MLRPRERTEFKAALLREEEERRSEKAEEDAAKEASQEWMRKREERDGLLKCSRAARRRQFRSRTANQIRDNGVGGPRSN